MDINTLLERLKEEAVKKWGKDMVDSDGEAQLPLEHRGYSVVKFNTVEKECGCKEVVAEEVREGKVDDWEDITEKVMLQPRWKYELLELIENL